MSISSIAADSPLIWLLVVSMLINLAGLVFLVRVIHGRGGIAYLKAWLLKDNEATMDIGSRARRDMFATLPTPPTRPIVFLGDSITSACEWGEAFGVDDPVLNRGIGGDTTLGVLDRLSEICRLNPKAVFLMIGANDPQMLGNTPNDTLRTCRLIIDQILKSSPDVRIYVESVLPSRSPKFNSWGDELNSLLQTLQDGKQIKYIDLRPLFLDAGNALDLRLTYDGLHLSAAGYQVWRNAIAEVVEEIVSPQMAAKKALA